MTTAGGDTTELTELLVELTRQRRGLVDVVGDAADAIARFEGRSSQYVPALPPHRARGDELAARIVGLSDEVGRCRDALHAADRWSGSAAVGGLVDLESARQWAVAAPMGAGWAWAGFRRAVLDADHPQRWTHARLKAAMGAGAARLGPDDLRSFVELLNDEDNRIRRRLTSLDDLTGPWLEDQSLRGLLAGTGDDIARLRGRMSVVTREVTEATGRLGRARASVANTKIAAVARIGSRGIGVAGAVMSGVGAVQSWQEGDTEAAVTGALATASSIAMLSGVPALQVAGAIVQGGLLVYEHREQLAAGVSAIGSGLVHIAKGLF